MAARFYDETFDVAKNMHAVERNRRLAAAVFGYTLSPEMSYGIGASLPHPNPLPRGEREHLTEHRYSVLLHSTSRADKEWDEAAWIALAQFLNANEIEVLLPWGSETEKARSNRLKQALVNAFVPSRMPLAKLAKLLSSATLIAGTDTGLTHFAAALGRPTIGIYRGSDPRLTGLYGAAKAVNVGEFGRAPSADEVIAAAGELLA